MKRKQVVLLLGLAILAAAIAVLAVRNPRPPYVPSDDVHARWDGAAACLECHGVAGPVPRSPNHPLGDDCLRCHAWRR
jgi:hypothetical protein